MTIERAPYQCKAPESGEWRPCYAPVCNRERRINQEIDMLERLQNYKMLLDSGKELNDLQKADLNVIGEHIKKVIETFIEALTVAFEPIIQVVAQSLKDLWESLPEDFRNELARDTSPRLEFTLGDMAQPSSVAGGVVNAVLQSPYDQPLRNPPYGQTTRRLS